MKVDVILEDNGDRMAMMKAMQNRRFAGMRDSLSREDISHLLRMVRLKGRKQNPRRGVPDEALDKFQSLGLADENGPTPLATPFLRWVTDNPNREQRYADKRGDADDALRRGQLKRDNDWVDPKQKKARKIVKNLSDEEMVIFDKLYNRYLNKRTRNLAKSWGNVPATDAIAMQRKGIIDDEGNLTDIGEFAVNYYTAFKNDPDGLDRVSRAQRVGNYGDTARRRRRRSRRATD